MIKQCVVLDGKVINIGPWNYFYDENGIAKNPMPEGAVILDVDIVQDADGGWVPAADYERLRKVEYPPIGDQLDALWKLIEPAEGSEAEAMKDLIMTIKSKYPKPSE